MNEITDHELAQVEAGGWKAAAGVLSTMWQHAELPMAELFMLHSDTIQQRLIDQHESAGLDQYQQAIRCSKTYHDLCFAMVLRLTQEGVDATRIATAILEMRRGYAGISRARTAQDMGWE